MPGNPQYPIRPGQKSADTVSRNVAAQRQKLMQRSKNLGGGAGATNQRKQAAKGKWSAEQQRQREEAGRKSAAKRRKGGAAGGGRSSGGGGGGGKLSPQQQETLRKLGQQIEQFKKLYRTMVGMKLKPEDVVKGKDGSITGKTPEAHEKLLRAMKKLGMDFEVDKDGSAQFVNPLTDKVTTIGPAPKGKNKTEWSPAGQRLEELPPEKPRPTVQITAIGGKTRT